MREFWDGPIDRLATALKKAGVAQETRAQILAGGETITKDTTPAQRTDWFRNAMQRMDALLPEETRHSVREACACCLGGKRDEMAKGIAKENATLEERIAALNEAHLGSWYSVTQLPDDTIQVRFWPEGATNLRCPCLKDVKEPLPITYCYCCGGHVKKHLQTALGRKLAVTVVTTVLSSGGKEGCTFDFRLVE